jgi:hypothetical protein
MSDEMMDRKLRELTYRLVEMAPEAPPFPEAHVVKLTPPPTHHRELTQRRPWLGLAAAAVIVIALVAIPLFLLGPNDGDVAGPGETQATTSTTAAQTTAGSVAPPTSDATTPTNPPTTLPTETTVAVTVPAVTGTYNVYVFSAGSPTPIGDPGLVALRRQSEFASQPSVTDLASEAIRSLITGSVAAPYSSEVPAGLTDYTVTLDGSTLIVDLPSAFESGGGSFSMFGRITQLVFTATQFPEVDGVTLLLDGQPVESFSGEGLILDPIMTRAGYYDSGTLPSIFVDSPGFGAEVTSPFTMTGVANVFEARFGYELLGPDGQILDEGFADASCGTGCWGDFAVELSYDLPQSAMGELVVYTNSPRDGSRTDEVRYEVTLVVGD